MVAQAPRRTNDDVCAGNQLTRFRARVHAADAGDDARAGFGVEPLQFPLHLHGEFTRRRDDQRQRLGSTAEFFIIAEQRLGEREAERDGLAGSGLGGDEEIAVGGIVFQNRQLNGRRHGVVAAGKRARQRGMCGRERHGDDRLFKRSGQAGLQTGGTGGKGRVTGWR